MKLHCFTYSVFRYVPDPVREEQVNLGVVVVSDADHVSRGAFLSAFRRKITALNPDQYSDHRARAR
ncbi:MAG: DUF3037 domain-containing protein [Dehalococcoidia bacterium]